MLLKNLQLKWAKLVCWCKGHHYVPAYRQMIGTPKNRRGHFKLVQYDCDRCCQPTKWMRDWEHRIFVRLHKPSWGGPGTDSQNRSE
ncbi:hypothetical protein D3C81_365220 [compost metagenome]